MVLKDISVHASAIEKKDIMQNDFNREITLEQLIHWPRDITGWCAPGTGEHYRCRGYYYAHECSAKINYVCSCNCHHRKTGWCAPGIGVAKVTLANIMHDTPAMSSACWDNGSRLLHRQCTGTWKDLWGALPRKRYYCKCKCHR